MDLKLTDFIKVYDNVLSKGECNSCIKIFEEGVDKKVYDTEHLKFTQFWIPTNSYTPLFNNIKSKMNRRHSEYRSYLSECLDYVSLFPSKYSFEKFKIKKYEPELKHEFRRHTDSSNVKTSTRFLSSLVYLNDVEEGGQTVFNDVIINPKRGRLIIFPPLWMFPHAGKVPISNIKYILTTYLTYSI